MTPAILVAAALYATSAVAINHKKVDACQCLNWKETYAAGRAQCGQGFEFTRALGYPQASYGTAQDWLTTVEDQQKLHGLQSAMGAEFCKSFYMKFDDTKCARAAMDSSPTEWYGKSWCYVSTGCSSAMAVTSAQVSVKLCEEGKDSLLSDMDPESLIPYGERMGFNVPGYFVKVAYPVERSFFYGSGEKQSEHQAQIAALKASGQIVLVDKIDEHQDKMIIVGDRVYNMPNSYEGFACVEGCEDAIYSFAPKDGLICYQGPKSSMSTLYSNVLQGMNRLMFDNSELWSSPCRDYGFTNNFLGQTCYGNTFTNTEDLKTHVDEEHFYSEDFMKTHSPEEIAQAQSLMGCASCSGHC